MEKNRQSYCSKLSLSLICLVWIGCSNPKKSDLLTIDVPKEAIQNITLKEVSTLIKTVELETNSNVLLTTVQDVKMSGDNLYVVDMAGKIFVFDKSGRFEYLLGKPGNGPGEYRYVSSIAFDDEAGLVFIASGRKLMEYTRENKFVKEKTMPFFIEHLGFIDQKLHLLGGMDGIKKGDRYVNERTLFQVKADFEIQDSIPIRSLALDKPMAASFPYKHYFSNFGNENYIYLPVLTNESVLRDSLYQIQGKSLLPSVKFNFEPPYLNQKGDKKIWIKNMVNSRSYLTCEYDREGERMLYFYNKNTAEGINLKEGFLDGDGNSVIPRPLDLENDVFYYLRSPVYTNTRTEEANPTIEIIKFD